MYLAKDVNQTLSGPKCMQKKQSIIEVKVGKTYSFTTTKFPAKLGKEPTQNTKAI